MHGDVGGCDEVEAGRAQGLGGQDSRGSITRAIDGSLACCERVCVWVWVCVRACACVCVCVILMATTVLVPGI